MLAGIATRTSRIRLADRSLISLLLQASNLGDESYRTYAGSKDRPLETIEWGRTLLLGASYKF